MTLKYKSLIELNDTKIAVLVYDPYDLSGPIAPLTLMTLMRPNTSNGNEPIRKYSFERRQFYRFVWAKAPIFNDVIRSRGSISFTT